MEEALLLRRIREEFPNVTWTSHRYLTHGWDHAVLILDEALVFRAPKAQANRDALANEAKLLRYLQPRVDVGVPDYVYESADSSFAGYRLLAGRELDVATFGRLSDTARERIAEQLATFLTAVHETPKSVARECGVSEQDPEKDHEDLVRDVETLVLPRLASHEVEVIRAFLTELAAKRNRPARRRSSTAIWTASTYSGTRAGNRSTSSTSATAPSETPRSTSLDCSPTGSSSPNASWTSTTDRRMRGGCGGHSCTSAGRHWKRWHPRCRATRARSRKATRSSGRSSECRLRARRSFHEPAPEPAYSHFGRRSPADRLAFPASRSTTSGSPNTGPLTPGTSGSTVPGVPPPPRSSRLEGLPPTSPPGVSPSRVRPSPSSSTHV